MGSKNYDSGGGGLRDRPTILIALTVQGIHPCPLHSLY